MKLFFLILFSFFLEKAHAASCCVANTSVSNLMVLPSKWQQTASMSQARVIGDTNTKGSSTFRNSKNQEQTTSGRMDLAYSWTSLYQSGVSTKYQNKSRSFNGKEANDSGWSDVGLSHAFQLKQFSRTWIFQTLNIPTARSIYDSHQSFAVDAQGNGTYQSSLGVFSLNNFKEWDYFISPEIHHSLARSFSNKNEKTTLNPFWGGSVTTGVGYIPWRSKFRYGVNLTPRLEGPKTVSRNGVEQTGKESMVWDTVLNVTYSIDAEYSLGLSYLDQTVMGPARNTLLNRSVGFIFQTRWL
jgi:hypothetical protein